MTAESYRSYSADLFADTTNAVARTRWPPSSGTTFGILIFAIALVVGLATAGDYGITIDEFNTEDYGRKALAWYTSGFRDRASFEAVEPPLWYYGPWFQMLVAWVQSWAVADPLTIRHALTFVAGLCGLAALLPLGVLMAAAIMPIALLMWRHSTLYDGIRHVLFVIPMLGLLAGGALVRLASFLSRPWMVAGICAAAVYVGAAIANFVLLHPLEYVAVNLLAGGVRGAYG